MERAKDNSITLVGKIVTELTYSHSLFNEDFYTFVIRVPRLSENFDELPVTISHKLLNPSIQQGADVVVRGQVRSYNKYVDGSSKLILTVFARSIELAYKKDEVPNCVYLNGYICKKPIYRTTPFNREIADILLAVNRAFNKSDYIPAIAWGRNARFASRLEIGEGISLVGRMQSRKYEKVLPDGTTETRVAYEVSINSLELLPPREAMEHDDSIYRADFEQKEHL